MRVRRAFRHHRQRGREREAADLVVIGKHREDTLLDLFRGSTGERIVRFGSRPVLVVKQRPSRPYLRIMVGVDFSPASAEALRFALERQQRDLKAAVDRDMAEFLVGFGVDAARARPALEEGAPESVLLEAAERSKPDLIVVGTHGRTGLARAVLGSVAERVLSEAACDVLAVRKG